jgi:serine protease SohB
MSEFLTDYGLFLAKTITFLAAAFVLMAMAAAFSKRQHPSETLRVEKLNRKYRNLTRALRRSLVSGGALKKLKKQHKAEEKADKQDDGSRPRTFLIEFKGDIRAQGVASLREEITAILSVVGDDDEILVRLENPGGMVHEHGLAAAQLARVRDAGVRLVVAVDKVAASGGYLMACVADRIVAAPFAIVGSIGVIAQLPNFNRLLDEKGIDFEQITAGKYKRTVTMFGKNTDEDRAKLKEELEDVHRLFKTVVSRYRPELDLEHVATGEHWLGTQAQELGLIDEVTTSDAWLSAALDARDVFSVKYEIKRPLPQRISGAIDSAVSRLVDGLRGGIAVLRRGP